MTSVIEHIEVADIAKLKSTFSRSLSHKSLVATIPIAELPPPPFAASVPVKKLSMIMEEVVEEEKKVKKEKAPKKRREVVMSYKINCVSDISAILGTVEVDLKVHENSLLLTHLEFIICNLWNCDCYSGPGIIDSSFLSHYEGVFSLVR